MGYSQLACLGSWRQVGPQPPSAHLGPHPAHLLRPAGPGHDERLPDSTAGCPRPPEACAPPPAAWLCQELTGAASKHPWAPAQASALAIRALLWAQQRCQGGGWRGASREEKAPSRPAGPRSRWGNEHAGSSSLPKPRGARYVSHPSLVSTSACRSPRSLGSCPPHFPLSCASIPPLGEGVGAGEGTRSRGKGVVEGTQAGEGVAIQFPELVPAIQVVS